jgi:hypothetical protein
VGLGAEEVRGQVRVVLGHEGRRVAEDLREEFEPAAIFNALASALCTVCGRTKPGAIPRSGRPPRVANLGVNSKPCRIAKLRMVRIPKVPFNADDTPCQIDAAKPMLSRWQLQGTVCLRPLYERPGRLEILLSFGRPHPLYNRER